MKHNGSVKGRCTESIGTCKVTEDLSMEVIYSALCSLAFQCCQLQLCFEATSVLLEAILS